MSENENPDSYPLRKDADMPEDAAGIPDITPLDGLQMDSGTGGSLDQIPSGEKRDWYVADKSGNCQGPFSLEVLKTRIGLGALNPDTLVWRKELPTWAPAASVPEVAAILGIDAGLVPPPVPRANTPQVWKMLDELFLNPEAIRIAGRLSLAAGLVTLLVSLVLSYWGHTWFTGGFLFLAIWINSEAGAAILQTLTQSKRP